MNPSTYFGPSVFGFDTDRPVRRIACISAHTSPLATLGGKDAGGMNVYVRELSLHQANLGLQVDIFTRRTDSTAPDLVELAPGVNVINITAGPSAPLAKDQLFPLLPAFAHQMVLHSIRSGSRYDVVHAHYWLSGWVAHLLRRYWDTPFVQMFHTTGHMKNAVSGADHREPALRVQTERRLVALADSLIAANPAERADLIWNLGCAAEKVCTIPPGVDLDLFRPRSRADARQRLGLDPDRPIVLFVGRVDPIKGIDTLLDAFNRLTSAPKRNPLLLFVGGDLDERNEPIGPLADVAAQAKALGLGGKITLLGSQPQNELPWLYSAADLVVVPSRYESFGLVAVEAMAAGIPVVATRVGGLAYTIEEETSGLLVPMGSAGALAAAIDRVLADDDLRASLAVGARQAAERFAWPAVATSIHHLYQRLAAGHRADLCCDEEIFA